MDLSVSNIKENNADIYRLITTYSSRFARLHFLKYFCFDDHPVLKTEINLVEMAKSKLQERLLIDFDSNNISKIRPIIEGCIRNMAKNNLNAYIDDGDIKIIISCDMDNDKLDDLFDFGN